MSVYQVDEYYIHISLSDSDQVNLDQVSAYIDNKGYEGEVNKDGITVDGFESEESAQEMEDIIIGILG